MVGVERNLVVNVLLLCSSLLALPRDIFFSLSLSLSVALPPPGLPFPSQDRGWGELTQRKGSSQLL